MNKNIVWTRIFVIHVLIVILSSLFLPLVGRSPSLQEKFLNKTKESIRNSSYCIFYKIKFRTDSERTEFEAKCLPNVKRLWNDTNVKKIMQKVYELFLLFVCDSWIVENKFIFFIFSIPHYPSRIHGHGPLHSSPFAVSINRHFDIWQ